MKSMYKSRQELRKDTYDLLAQILKEAMYVSEQINIANEYGVRTDGLKDILDTLYKSWDEAFLQTTRLD